MAGCSIASASLGLLVFVNIMMSSANSIVFVLYLWVGKSDIMMLNNVGFQCRSLWYCVLYYLSCGQLVADSHFHCLVCQESLHPVEYLANDPKFCHLVEQALGPHCVISF